MSDGATYPPYVFTGAWMRCVACGREVELLRALDGLHLSFHRERESDRGAPYCSGSDAKVRGRAGGSGE